MTEALLLDRWGYLILAALVIGEQVGIPLPAVPALLGMGSLAANGRISLPLVLGTVATAGLTADLVWFELGRRRGRRVLDALRRVSRAPDARLRRAESLIRRYAVPAVLIAKFIPGLTLVTPPLAGIFGIARARFLLYDLAGILLWAGTWSGLGYVFSDAIGAAAALAAGLGTVLGLIVVAVVYVLLKRIPRRRRFLRAWIARLLPQRGQGMIRAWIPSDGAGPHAGAVKILSRVRAGHPRVGILSDRHRTPRLRRPGRLSAKPRVLFRNAPVRRAFTTARKHKPRRWHGS